MDIRPERSKFRKINKPMVFSVILFTALVIWLIVSVGSAGTAAEKSRSSSVYKTVMNSALLCYSIEGEYPPDLDYLKENYGVRIDSEKYTVHYEYFGANIRPTITVNVKGSERTVLSEDEQN